MFPPISPLSGGLLKFIKSISAVPRLTPHQPLILSTSSFKGFKIDTKKNKKSKSILNKS
jgi:hypothetical protein